MSLWRVAAVGVFAAVLLSAPALAQSGSVVIAQHTVGTERQVANESARLPLATAMAIGTQDRLMSQADGQTDLAISRHGIMELGGDSELFAERLPFSTFDVDLRTQFRLERGYLRLIWKYPDFGARWPMVVDVGPFRISVTSGEYFVEHRDQRTILCVAEGEAAISTPGQAEAVVFRESACYRLISGAPAQVAAVPPGGFVDTRNTRTLLPLAIDIGLAWAEPSQSVALPTPSATPIPSPSAQTVSPTPPIRQQTLSGVRNQSDGETVRSAERPELGVTTATPKPRPSPTPRSRPLPVVATPEAVAILEGRWALNVASLDRQDAADEVRNRMIKAGFAPDIVEATVNGQRWYRVQFRGLADASTARALASRLDREAGIRGAWVIPPSR